MGHNYIFSLWDPSSAVQVTNVIYAEPDAFLGRFGGEGTGYHFLSSLKKGGSGWILNSWTTLLTRCWDVADHTYFGLWVSIQGSWRQLVTIDYPYKAARFRYGATSFLENYGSSSIGSLRYMKTRNGWKRYSDKSWSPFTSGSFDVGTIGGTKNDFFYMATQSGMKPNVNSGNSVQYVPKPTSTMPDISVAQIDSAQISYDQDHETVSLSWVMNANTCPQFSYSIQISTAANVPVYTQTVIAPHIRSTSFLVESLPVGLLTVSLTVTDVLDRNSNILQGTILQTDAAPPLLNSSALLSISSPTLFAGRFSSYLYYASLSSALSSTFTISLCITTTSVNVGIMSIGRSKYSIDGEGIFQIDGSGYLRFSDYSAAAGDGFDGTSTVAVNTGLRTYVAFVRYNNVGFFYVNGDLAGQITTINSVAYNNKDIVFGKDYRAGCCYFMGTMDSINIHDVALTRFQIRTLYLASGASYLPSVMPTSQPSPYPTTTPTAFPTSFPTATPTSPTASPTPMPSVVPNTTPLLAIPGPNTFDGTSSYLYYASLSSALSSTFTISLCITTTSVNAYIMSIGRSPSNFNGEGILQIDGSGYLRFWDYSGSYGLSGSSSVAVNIGIRTHVAFVRHNNIGYFYVNGALAGQMTATKSISYKNKDLVIGKDYRDGVSFFKGNMDSISIYNAALLPYQIRSLYANTILVPTQVPTSKPT